MARSAASKRRAADGVVDDVDAAEGLQLGAEVVVGVERVRRPGGGGHRQPLGAAGDGDDAGAEQRADLDRGQADAARRRR